MGIMKPRNRGEHQKYLSCHHLVILHHTFTDPNLNGSFDPFAALEPRLFTQGFGDPLAHLLCKRSWDVRETSNKQQWIWRWKRFACFFFNPQPCAWAVSLWDFSSSYTFPYFFQSCILLIIFGAFLMTPPIWRTNFSNILSLLQGHLWILGLNSIFTTVFWLKDERHQSCEPIPDLAPRQIGIPKFHHPIFHDVTLFLQVGMISSQLSRNFDAFCLPNCQI